MLQNNKIVKMGSHGSTDLVAHCEVGTVEAGLACHRKSDNTVTLLASDGQLVGVSLGKDLFSESEGKVSVARSGNLVPLQVTPEGVAIGDLTFIPLVEGYSIEFLAGGVTGSEVVTVDNDTKVISVSMHDAVSTATQIKTAMDAETDIDAIIASTTIAAGQGAVAQDAFAETALPIASYVVPGGVVKVSATTGKATSGGTTTGAFYALVDGDTLKSGLKLDGTSVWCAYVDMGGGL